MVRDHAVLCRGWGLRFEILVCDDGSVDATWPILTALGAEAPELILLRNAARLGITRSMVRLFGVAQGAWWYFVPADGQLGSDALARLWAAREGAAVVVGRRTPRRDPRSRVLMARLYSAVLRLIYRLPVRDIDSVKLYDAAVLRRIGFESRTDFFQAELLIAYRRAGLAIRELPVPHHARQAGRALGVTPLSAFRSIRDLAWFVAHDLARQSRR